MKNRTPGRNAVLSLIPFVGITSFWYLGRKLGLITWIINIGLFLSLIFVSSKIFGLERTDTLIIVLLISNVFQYYLVKYLTEKKNKEINDKSSNVVENAKG